MKLSASRPIDARQQYQRARGSRMWCGPRATPRVGMFTERDIVPPFAEHGAAGVNLKISQLISVQQLVSCVSTDTLRTCSPSHEQEPHPPSAGAREYSLIGVSASATSRLRVPTTRRRESVSAADEPRSLCVGPRSPWL